MCTNFRCRNCIDGEISVAYSFLHPKISCVNVFRSGSCSQPIRQRIRRRTFALACNFHQNSKIHVYRSHGWSNLTSFHRCVELHFSLAQRCQALKCGSRFHCATNPVVPFLETGSPAKVLSTKTDCVNVFLPLESYCSSGFRGKIPCYTLQWNKVGPSRFTRPLGQMFCGFGKV